MSRHPLTVAEHQAQLATRVQPDDSHMWSEPETEWFDYGNEGADMLEARETAAREWQA